MLETLLKYVSMYACATSHVRVHLCFSLFLSTCPCMLILFLFDNGEAGVVVLLGLPLVPTAVAARRPREHGLELLAVLVPPQVEAAVLLVGYKKNTG